MLKGFGSINGGCSCKNCIIKELKGKNSFIYGRVRTIFDIPRLFLFGKVAP
jgi:hypothetical protein